MIISISFWELSFFISYRINIESHLIAFWSPFRHLTHHCSELLSWTIHSVLRSSAYRHRITALKLFLCWVSFIQSVMDFYPCEKFTNFNLIFYQFYHNLYKFLPFLPKIFTTVSHKNNLWLSNYELGELILKYLPK